MKKKTKRPSSTSVAEKLATEGLVSYYSAYYGVGEAKAAAILERARAYQRQYLWDEIFTLDHYFTTGDVMPNRQPVQQSFEPSGKKVLGVSLNESLQKFLDHLGENAASLKSGACADSDLLENGNKQIDFPTTE